MKQQFIDLKGISVLRTWLTQLNQTNKTDMYMNCLGLVLPLSRVGDHAVEDLCDAGFDKLLVRHAVASPREYLPRFFLILRAICPK